MPQISNHANVNLSMRNDMLSVEGAKLDAQPTNPQVEGVHFPIQKSL